MVQDKKIDVKSVYSDEPLFDGEDPLGPSKGVSCGVGLGIVFWIVLIFLVAYFLSLIPLWLT